ncbi:MAG: hypothetical protein ACK56I_08275, partial [bacterium]
DGHHVHALIPHLRACEAVVVRALPQLLAHADHPLHVAVELPVPRAYLVGLGAVEPVPDEGRSASTTGDLRDSTYDPPHDPDAPRVPRSRARRLRGVRPRGRR